MTGRLPKHWTIYTDERGEFSTWQTALYNAPYEGVPFTLENLETGAKTDHVSHQRHWPSYVDNLKILKELGYA